MHLTFIRLLAAALAFGCGGFSISAAAAWPDRPIRIIVPNSPGGVTDLTARIIAQPLGIELGQSVVVDNRAGAGGTIAAREVARAPADGYTLLLGTSATHGTNPSTYKNLPYKARKDFVPVAMLATTPLMVIVNPSVPAKTLPELIEYLKANPGKINFASTGNGGFIHLSTELFAMHTGTKPVHIAYKGSAPAQNDLLGGDIQMMFDTLSSAAPLAESGKVRALGVTSSKRIASLPDLPTVAEVTGQDYEALTWLALYAPIGTPPDVVKRLNEIINMAFQDPKVNDALKKAGVDAVGGTPEVLADFQNREISKWAKVVKTIKYEPQ